MPYIGNTIRAADDYRLIDDISSSFNGSTTSFALQVAGSAPVPFPKSPQQVLISVNGVIQEPDPTGASGFNLVGTNIVFSSAPTNGHAFFGIIYATADYLNSGGNFPSGSLGAPSITFVGDEDTGIYRKGSGSVAFVADSTEIANTDSNGITISSGNLIIPDKIIHNGDTNTAVRFPAVDTVTVETGGSERFRVDSNGKIGIGTNAPGDFHTKASNLVIHSSGDTGMTISSGTSSDGRIFFADGTSGSAESEGHIRYDHATNKMHFATSDANAVEIDSSGNFLPASDSSKDIGSNSVRFANGYFDTLYGNGANLTGINTDLVSDTSPQLGGDLDTNGNNITFDDNDQLRLGNATGGDIVIAHKTSDNNGHIENHTGDLLISTKGAGDDVIIESVDDIELKPQGGEDGIKVIGNGAVELYNDNVKRFNTNTSGAKVHGNNGTIFEASCATNSTASILFQNTEANTSGDMRILVKTATNQGSDPYIKFDAGGNDMIVGTLYAGGANNKLVLGHGNSPSGGVIGLHIDGNGQVTPDSNNARDLGSASLRWANVFTMDLQLSNKGGDGNSVDGTWGDYTIQEGLEDLYLINNRTGKKFKFNLTEVA